MLLLLLAAPAAAQPTFPPLTGRVVDAANILSPTEEQAIDAKLAALETQSRRQLVVATIPDLQGYEISDYGYQLGRAWGLGDKQRNDGALLIVAPNERKVRIEVGYGLEGILTDALSSLIIANDIVPRFRDGDFPGGIAAGIDRLVLQLQLPEEEARKVAEQAQAQQVASQQAPEFGFGSVIFLLFVLLFFVLPILRGLRGGRRYGRGGSGLGPVILWSALDAMSHGSRGGSFGGGGFGGGGFSGGGGSFGGGGASGSW